MEVEELSDEDGGKGIGGASDLVDGEGDAPKRKRMLVSSDEEEEQAAVGVGVAACKFLV